ncbi:MAG: glutathione S-transferase family protein [Erythrobacter sp.]
MADLVIYGSPVSPFVRKVAAQCLEKGVEFEIEAVNVFDPPEWFREISPMKRIPVLRDRAIAEEGPAGTIADSSAICGYIEKKHPETPMLPADPYAHGRALMMEEYADTNVAMATGLGMFRPIFFALNQGKEPDVAAAQEAWATKLPPVLDYLESQLDGANFFAGNALSLADISVTCCLMQGAMVAEMPLDKWPALAAHQARMMERPSIAGPYAKADGFIRKSMPDRIALG